MADARRPARLPLLNVRDVLRYAHHQWRESTCGSTDKTGSLKPGKEADIIILDAHAINVVAASTMCRARSCR